VTRQKRVSPVLKHAAYRTDSRAQTRQGGAA
jgi:hypothetical protein